MDTYTQLPVIGYLIDGKHTGFKTAVVQNGVGPAVQVSDDSGLVRGFIECKDGDIERIYRANFPISKNSIVGEELIYVFRTATDLFFEKRTKLLPRLLVEVRNPESMTPADAISVMIFARLPSAQINRAIDNFALSLKERGLASTEDWAERFKQRVGKTLSKYSENRNTEYTFDTTDFDKLEAKARAEVDKIEDNERKSDAAGRLDAYFAIRSFLEQPNVEIQDKGMRDLFALSATVNQIGLPHLAYLVNLLYITRAWERFIKLNEKNYRRKIRTQTPASSIAALANNIPSEQVIGLNDILGNFIPFRISTKSRTNFLPAGLLVSGRVVSRSDDAALFVEAGNSLVEIPSSRVAVAHFNDPDIVGKKILFATTKNDQGSCRGREFVAAVFDLLFPSDTDHENPMDFVLGASNSWLVIRASNSKVARLVAGEGVYLEQIKEILGLRRITAVVRADQLQTSIRNFCRASWREIQVEFRDDRCILSFLSYGERGLFDFRKLRAFRSMWAKLFPSVEPVFRHRASEIEDWVYINSSDAS